MESRRDAVYDGHLGRDQVFMIDRDNAVFKISGLTFPKRKDPTGHLSETLLDGEMVLDEVDGQKSHATWSTISFSLARIKSEKFSSRRD